LLKTIDGNILMSLSLRPEIDLGKKTQEKEKRREDRDKKV